MLVYIFLSLLGSVASNKEQTTSVFKFLFSNEQICGDPFADADWIPAYDDCSVGCEASKFLCLMHVESREQRCEQLPSDCTAALRRTFNWVDTEEITGDVNVDRFEADMLQTEEATSDYSTNSINEAAETTTTTLSTTTVPATEAPVVKVEKDFDDPYSTGIIQEEEEVPETTTTSTTTTTVTTQYRFAEEQSGTAGAYEYPIQPGLRYSTTKTPIVVSSLRPRWRSTLNTGSAVHKVEPTTTERPIRMITGIRVDTTKHKIYYSTTTTTPFIAIHTYPEMDPFSIVAETVEHFLPTSTGGSRIDIVPPPPPPDPMHDSDESELSSMIKSFAREEDAVPPKSVAPVVAVDLSRRCCEWALNGLCDGHWQKVRKLCPKSCGVLACEEIEGVKSCNRLLDINVEECYQSLRKLRLSGVKSVQSKPIAFSAKTETSIKHKPRKGKKSKRKRRTGLI